MSLNSDSTAIHGSDNGKYWDTRELEDVKDPRELYLRGDAEGDVSREHVKSSSTSSSICERRELLEVVDSVDAVDA